MQALPHYYRVTGAGAASGDVELRSAGLTPLLSASPVEFGGPGGKWSPESLLAGAVADCFILTFRAIAAASRLPWISLSCDVTGTLDRVDGAMQFTRFELIAHLVVPPGADAARARLLLEKAERNCLISRSLKATMVLDATVEMVQADPGSVPAEAKTT
jgi:organic hydroperoxide reductase OsmC/OhrA